MSEGRRGCQRVRSGVHLWVIAAALVLAGIGAAPAAAAQAVDAVHHLLDLVTTNRDDMNDAAGRLRPLVLAGTVKEAEPIQTVLFAVGSLEARADALELVGSVLLEMHAPDDLTVARSAFRRAARRTLETANDQLDFMNESLKRIKSPEASAQATVARDAIKAIRDAVQPFTARD